MQATYTFAYSLSSMDISLSGIPTIFLYKEYLAVQENVINRSIIDKYSNLFL